MAKEEERKITRSPDKGYLNAPLVAPGSVRGESVVGLRHSPRAISGPRRSETFCCSSHTAFRGVPPLSLLSAIPCPALLLPPGLHLVKSFSNAREPFKQSRQLSRASMSCLSRYQLRASPKRAAAPRRTHSSLLSNTITAPRKLSDRTMHVFAPISGTWNGTLDHFNVLDVARVSNPFTVHNAGSMYQWACSRSRHCRPPASRSART